MATLRTRYAGMQQKTTRRSGSTKRSSPGNSYSPLQASLKSSGRSGTLISSLISNHFVEKSPYVKASQDSFIPRSGPRQVIVKRHQRTSSDYQVLESRARHSRKGTTLSQLPSITNFERSLNASPEGYTRIPNPSSLQISRRSRNVSRQQSKNRSGFIFEDNSAQEKITTHIKLSFSINRKPPGTRIDFYDIRREIGHGAFGKVYLAIHKLTDLKVAVKVIDKSRLKDDKARVKVLREVSIFRQVRHKNVVSLFEVFEDDQFFYIVMEFCGGGDLLNFVREKGRLSETEAKLIFVQILEAVDSLHSLSVLHRDLKLENVLLDAPLETVKLCDFGISRIIEPGITINEQCGTPAYLAPEVLYEDGYRGFASDVWSLGVVLYAMCIGRMPYKGKTLDDMKILLKTTSLLLPESLSDSLKALIVSMLEFDPKSRISIKSALTHDWFSTPSQDKSPKITFKGPKHNMPTQEETQDILVERVVALGYPKDFVVKSVSSRAMNHAAATYFLLNSAIY